MHLFNNLIYLIIYMQDQNILINELKNVAKDQKNINQELKNFEE